APVRVGWCERMVLRERGGRFLVVPERDRHRTLERWWRLAGKRDGERGVEPTQSTDVGGSGTVAQRPERRAWAEVGDIHGGDHARRSLPHDAFGGPHDAGCPPPCRSSGEVRD